MFGALLAAATLGFNVLVLRAARSKEKTGTAADDVATKED